MDTPLSSSLTLYTFALTLFAVLCLVGVPVTAAQWPAATAAKRFDFLVPTSLGAALTATVIAFAQCSGKLTSAPVVCNVFGFLFPVGHMLFMAAVTTIRWAHPELYEVTSACLQFSMISAVSSFLVLVILPKDLSAE